MPDSWSLHPQLQRDTVEIGDLPLCRVLASLDANYPWLILVPRLPGLVDVTDLDAAAQMQITTEIDLTARALKAATSCSKLNVAALGNMVPQLHVHIIARTATDAAWPRPVWGAVPAREYAPGKLKSFTDDIAHKIGLK
jgi:diadenosine tetraphosphate (Ap4A) HIT family hydrolase